MKETCQAIAAISRTTVANLIPGQGGEIVNKCQRIRSRCVHIIGALNYFGAPKYP